MKVLFIGDIVGRPGRRITCELLPGLKKKHRIDLTIANGENLAGGIGATPEVLKEVVEAGVDVVTFGNHVWRKKQMGRHIGEFDCLVRPANYPQGTPGCGSILYRKGDIEVGIVNLLGRVFMNTLECPFGTADREVTALREVTRNIIVDFHAEATSEKRALGWYLDGRVSAVVGTHTHIQTSDEAILPQGTGYITDAGMTGGQRSVIGVKCEGAIERFLTQMPVPFDVADEGVALFGVVIELDPDTGLTREIYRLTNVSSV